MSFLGKATEVTGGKQAKGLPLAQDFHSLISAYRPYVVRVLPFHP
jgi:hypothetical protein